MFKRLIAGRDGRRTRFHTARNELIALAPAMGDLAGSLTLKLSSKLGAKRPAVPWWPTLAIPAVEAVLRPDMKAIEFGSGSSSIWIGQRVKSLLTVEDDPSWAEKTRERLRSAGLVNVVVKLAREAEYWSAGDDDSFDFAVVDGRYRWKCLEHTLPRISRGGYVYFDNADADKDAATYENAGDAYLAQKAIEAFVAARPGSRIDKIASMTHGELFASEGWLVHVA